MKIGELAGQGPELPGARRKARERGGPGGAKGVGGAADAARQAPAFAEAFLNAGQALTARALEDVLDELGRQGERLAANQNFQELERYRGLVQEFVRKAVQGMGTLAQTRPRADNGKVHVLLKKIDGEMEALTREVMSRQAAPLAILTRLDQIRGLLLDLYK